MAPEVTIEAAESSDVEVLAELWVALASEQREHGSRIEAEANREAMRLVLAHHVAGDTALVARRQSGGEECVVGFVTFEVEDEGLVRDAKRGVIQNVYVAPPARGEGVGSSLLDRAEARLASSGCGVVVIEAMAENAGARRLYRRRGYEPYRVSFERVVDSDTHSREDG